MEMKLIVIDCLYLNGRYAIAARYGEIKLLIEATANSSLKKGDFLTPSGNMRYIINNEERNKITELSSTNFSISQWCILKRLSLKESKMQGEDITLFIRNKIEFSPENYR